MNLQVVVTLSPEAQRVINVLAREQSRVVDGMHHMTAELEAGRPFDASIFLLLDTTGANLTREIIRVIARDIARQAMRLMEI